MTSFVPLKRFSPLSCSRHVLGPGRSATKVGWRRAVSFAALRLSVVQGGEAAPRSAGVRCLPMFDSGTALLPTPTPRRCLHCLS